nr:hypothetical protein [Tanacetum cinerariifolium]
MSVGGEPVKMPNGLEYTSCGSFIASTVIVNNISNTVVRNCGSSDQCVSSKRECIHPSGFASSCRIDQQPSFIGTESHCPVRKHSAKVSVGQTSGQNDTLNKQYSSSVCHTDVRAQQSIVQLSERETTFTSEVPGDCMITNVGVNNVGNASASSLGSRPSNFSATGIGDDLPNGNSATRTDNPYVQSGHAGNNQHYYS